MKLLEGVYLNGSREPYALEYWDSDGAVMRPLRNTNGHLHRVGAPYVCPWWLWEKVYRLAGQLQPGPVRGLFRLDPAPS